MGLRTWFGLSPRRDVDQTVSVSTAAVDEIVVTTNTEDILVRPSPSATEASVTLMGWSRRDVAITGEQRGRSFVVGPLPDPFFPPRLPEDLRVEVVVPASFNGRVSVASSSGAIELRDVSAEAFVVSTESGGVQLSGVDGDVAARTSSGAVTATWEPDTHRVRLPSMDIQSVSGAVDVRLPTAAQFSLDAASATGALLSTFPVEATRTTLSGRAGSADTTIRIRTTSGKVSVRTSD